MHKLQYYMSTCRYHMTHEQTNMVNYYNDITILLIQLNIISNINV